VDRCSRPSCLPSISPDVAPATLTATFLTSIAGITTYQILQATHGGTIAPDWALGAFPGAGGFAGGYLGARAPMAESARPSIAGPCFCGSMSLTVVVGSSGPNR
jgi:uncharacterized membrane protein YfcA